MGGRVYDPLAGRFTTADPILQAPFSSQGQNRFAYVFNDPINMTDPSGFDGVAAEGGFMGAFLGGGFISGGIQHLAAGGAAGAGPLAGGVGLGFNLLQTAVMNPFGGSPAGTYNLAAPSTAPSTNPVKPGGMDATGAATGVEALSVQERALDEGPFKGLPASAAGNQFARVPCGATPEQCRRRALEFNLSGGGFLPDGALIGVGEALGEALVSLVEWIQGPAIAGGADAFGVLRYSWAGGGRASFLQRGSRVIVDEIYRGTVARAGTAGTMLAKAIQQAGIAKPTELFIPNVLQKTGQSTAVLSNVLRDAASELGGTVQSVSQGVDAGKTWVLVTLGY